MEKYDVIIVGGGAGGAFAAYELTKLNSELSTIIIEKGAPLNKRRCPILEGKTEVCVKCRPCRIMSGYGGAGTLSDGKYNITTKFGGDLHKIVGHNEAMKLMEYIDEVLCGFGGSDAKLYSTGNSNLKTEALKNNMNLLDAKVRHLGTDRNREILDKMYNYTIKNKNIKFSFFTEVVCVNKKDNCFIVKTDDGHEIECKYLVLASGRSS